MKGVSCAVANQLVYLTAPVFAGVPITCTRG